MIFEQTESQYALYFLGAALTIFLVIDVLGLNFHVKTFLKEICH